MMNMTLTVVQDVAIGSLLVITILSGCTTPGPRGTLSKAMPGRTPAAATAEKDADGSACGAQARAQFQQRQATMGFLNVMQDVNSIQTGGPINPDDGTVAPTLLTAFFYNCMKERGWIESAPEKK